MRATYPTGADISQKSWVPPSILFNWWTRPSPGIKLAGHEFNHSPLSESENAWSYVSTVHYILVPWFSWYAEKIYTHNPRILVCMLWDISFFRHKPTFLFPAYPVWVFLFLVCTVYNGKYCRKYINVFFSKSPLCHHSWHITPSFQEMGKKSTSKPGSWRKPVMEAVTESWPSGFFALSCFNEYVYWNCFTLEVRPFRTHVFFGFLWFLDHFLSCVR